MEKSLTATGQIDRQLSEHRASLVTHRVEPTATSGSVQHEPHGEIFLDTMHEEKRC